MKISYRNYYLLHQVLGMVHKIGNCSSPTPSIFFVKILLASRNSYKVLFFYSFMFPCKIFDIEITKTKYSAMSILSLLLCYFISNQQFCSLNSFTTKNSLISICTSVWTQLNNWTEWIANVSFEKINLRCFKLHPINFSCLGFDRQIIDSFHIAAVRGDFRTVNRLLQDGVPVDMSVMWVVTRRSIVQLGRTRLTSPNACCKLELMRTNKISMVTPQCTWLHCLTHLKSPGC